MNMSAKRKKSAVALIREECANYFQGQCVPLDTVCPQNHSDSMLCKWFKNAVLPLNKDVHAQIMGADGLKICVVCGRVFRALSNRAKYCSECARKQRRKKDAERKYKARHGI